MIESMVMMYLLILSMTLQLLCILPPTLTTSWMDEKLTLNMARENCAVELLIGFLDLNDNHKVLKRNCISQLIQANLC